MNSLNLLKIPFTEQFFLDTIDICSQQENVSVEVIKNYENNLWWPKYVSDWRLRMVIAGWSTRVSYNMIEKFKTIVSTINRTGYDKLIQFSKDDLRNLIPALGLYSTRYDFLHSLNDFIISNSLTMEKIVNVSHNSLINQISDQVKGASYKVAQCAVLYAKGYNCGIFPVDSGMKDILGPCLGLRLPKGSKAHEIMRKIFEQKTEEYFKGDSINYS